MINKCGLDIGTSRWGQQIIAACASYQKNSWAGLSAKIQVTLKESILQFSFVPEICPTPYTAVEMLVPTLPFNWKIDHGLGPEVRAWQWNLCQGWPQANRGSIPQQGPSVTASPSITAGCLQRPPVSTPAMAPIEAPLACAWIPLEKKLQGILTVILLCFLQKPWLHRG